LLDVGVAAMARCKNVGSVLIPIIAMPPLFKNSRRETLIVVVLSLLA
jgi:hypothetical protein